MNSSGNGCRASLELTMPSNEPAKRLASTTSGCTTSATILPRYLTMKGHAQRAVQELLGHKDPKMTMHSSYLSPEHLKAAVGSLDELGLEVSQTKASR